MLGANKTIFKTELNKWSMKRIGIITLLMLLILDSCDLSKKDVECSPVPPFIYIDLINKDSISILGLNNGIDPDSVRFIINNKVITPRIDSNLIALNTTNLDTLSDKDFFLYLDNNDFDTIKLIINKNDGECGVYYDIIDFQYNRLKRVEGKRRIYKVLK